MIPLGGDHLVDVEPIEVRGIPLPFYLFVGSSKPHKNRQLLEGLPTVDAGGQYSARELVWLYKHAQALIVPSFYEGFGLPSLEAMSLSCPVLASNRASLPEVCADAALYFDPTNRESLDSVIGQLPSHRDEMIERGRKRCSAMSWELCAQRHAYLFAKGSIE